MNIYREFLRIIRAFTRNKRFLFSLLFAVFLIAAGIFLFLGKTVPSAYSDSAVFTLVPDKISQSATITISLPKGVSAADARQHISFTPTISGEWVESPSARRVTFRPRQKLAVGKYYAVTLAMQSKTLQKDFLVDDDPRVISIFPGEKAEAPETSAITIMFNRPMVALSTLDRLNSQNLPIDISPNTAGKFKWISTRSLQFTPEKRLQRSSSYAVTLKRGLVSIEGLEAPTFHHTFSTRQLRYESVSSGSTLYDQPIQFIFNQPVDLEKTKSQITLTRSDNGKAVVFNAFYGTRTVVDPETKKATRFTDKRILRIINAKDRNGRSNFWDFATSYNYAIKRATPLEGDIQLEEERKGVVTIADIIDSIKAESPRSKLVEPDVFDPQGKLFVNFFEDIDISRSVIEAQNLLSVGYGETCKRDENNQEVRIGNECEKVPNKKQLVLIFKPQGLTASQNIPVTFKRIVNAQGFTINATDLVRTIIIYPALKILRTFPGSNDDSADLTRLTICATTPLTPATVENVKQRLKSNITVGLWNWDNPRRAASLTDRSPCAIGEFENVIRYGLVPKSDYRITLNVVDDFGQNTQSAIAFTTGNLDQTVRKFFQMQKGYNVTSPDKTKLTYAVENLEYMNMNICQISARSMLTFVHDFPSQATAPAGLPCITTTDRRVELPKRFWTRNYFQINLKDYLSNPLGHYVVSFSHPEYRRLDWQWNEAQKRSIPVAKERIYEHTLLTVTRIAVAQKELQWDGGSRYDKNVAVTKAAILDGPQNLYWVSEFGSLAPLPGVTVDLYTDTFAKTASYTTDNQGIARANVVPKLSGAVVTNGSDSTVVSSEVDNLQWARNASSNELTYIYTDRPIYRPGQQVFIKGIYRVGYDGNYQVLSGKKVQIEIFGAKDESVLKQTLEINDYGTFTTNVTLDANASIGTYRIESINGNGYFDVEEYVPAAFKLDVSSDKEEYIAGDTMKLSLDANYYFGVPVDRGEVEYSMISQDYYFDRFNDGYFSFGSGWYYDYNAAYGDQFLLKGRTKLDKTGKATIEQPLDFSKFFKNDAADKSKIFVVGMTVKNANGQSVSAQKSFIVHRGEFYTGVALDNTFLAKGDRFTIRVKSVDTQGKERAATGVNVSVNKIKWEYFKRTQVDGGSYYESEKKKEPVTTFTVNTDSKGNAQKEMTATQEGEFEVATGATDTRGNLITSAQGFYVYGGGEVTVRPTNNETLNLATPKSQVDVGEKVKIIIESPYPHAKALVSLERGKIFSYEIIPVDRNFTEYTFDVKDQYIPNVYASILLLAPRPEIKYGQINYKVNTKERKLAIEIKPNKTHYLPGERVSLDISAKDMSGRPASAEISLAVADLSVLALKGNPKKDPLIFFYGDIPLTIATASNIKNILYEPDIPLGTKGGGGEPEDLTKKRRGIFKDTAFWQGIVRTNAQGKAHVEFALPDNLTTWQVESVGITKDTKLGVDYKEITARKDLMVIPLRPRFVIPGDEFLLGASVFNQTPESQTLDVSLQASTLIAGDTNVRRVTIASHESQTVYFSVKAPEQPDRGAHNVVIAAKNAHYEDSVESMIPIKQNNSYESVATAGYTNQAITKEYVYLPDTVAKDKGGITIKTSATLAVFLSDALNALISYPYGCSEQIASKLGSIAIVKRGLNLADIANTFKLKQVVFEGKEYSLDDVVRLGLARIYENQYPEGGFSYYKGLAPNVYLTLQVVNALQDLKEAGYQINQDALTRGAAYLYRETIQDPAFINNKDFTIITAYALSRLTDTTLDTSTLTPRIASFAKDKHLIHDTLSNASLAYLAILLTKGYPVALKDEVFSTLENRVSIDSRGAFLPLQDANVLFDYYETPIKDTALFVKALVADKRDLPISDKLLRWLLKSRSKDGAWGSTNNTLSVVSALTDFLAWKQETSSQFTLDISLNEKNIKTANFDKSTIFQTISHSLGIDRIPRNTLDTISIAKTNRNSAPNNFYYDIGMTYFLPANAIPPRDEGFGVARDFYARDDEKGTQSLTKASVGDVLKGHLTITVPKQRNFALIESFIPAGTELVNFSLETENGALKQEDQAKCLSGCDRAFPYDESGGQGVIDTTLSLRERAREFPDEAYNPRQLMHMRFIPDAQESHDDRLVLFKERLEPGVYDFDYSIRALIPGAYSLLPTIASELYFPENFGRSAGNIFTIQKP